MGPAILGRGQLSGYPAKHGSAASAAAVIEGPWRERKNRSDLTAVGDCGLPEPGRPDDPGPPSSPWRKSSVFKWRTGRPDSAVARLWTANLAETAPRPAPDRPTGRPTV